MSPINLTSFKGPSQHCLGVIPATFHVDGVEFFSNAEFVVWSLSSGVASGNASKCDFIPDVYIYICTSSWAIDFTIPLSCEQAKVWETKFPVAIVPTANMRNSSEPRRKSCCSLELR